MSFTVHKHWSENPPKFRPQIIDYFSLDRTRRICFDSSQLSYLYHRSPSKNVNFDLNEGMDIVQRRTHSPEKLNNLLKWIIHNSDKILANPDSGRWLQPNFICHPCLLRKIIATPYDKMNGWVIYAAKWKGNIYLCLSETEQEKTYAENETEIDRQMSSWGMKFEQYMRSDSPNQPPNTSEPVYESEEFNCVILSSLSDHHLLYAAEMDASLSDEKFVDPLPVDKLKFVELKTRISDLNVRKKNNFEKFISLRWWSQCYLAGIELLICGLRNDKGIIEEVKHYQVSSLHNYQNYWHPAIAMNFCDEFLKFVEKHVVDDYDRIIYKFVRVPRRSIVLRTESPLQNDLLPNWYISHESIEKFESVERSNPDENTKSVKKIKSDNLFYHKQSYRIFFYRIIEFFFTTFCITSIFNFACTLLNYIQKLCYSCKSIILKK